MNKLDDDEEEEGGEEEEESEDDFPVFKGYVKTFNDYTEICIAFNIYIGANLVDA